MHLLCLGPVSRAATWARAPWVFQHCSLYKWDLGKAHLNKQRGVVCWHIPKCLKIGKTWPARCLKAVSALQLGHLMPCLTQGIQNISAGGHFRKVPPWRLVIGSYGARPGMS